MNEINPLQNAAYSQMAGQLRPINQPVEPSKPDNVSIDSPSKNEFTAAKIEAYSNKDSLEQKPNLDRKAIGEEQMLKAMEKAMKLIAGKSTFLEFSIHEKTKQIMVKVKDNDTGEVIREIPPEKSFDFLAKVWEMTGIIVDERR